MPIAYTLLQESPLCTTNWGNSTPCRTLIPLSPMSHPPANVLLFTQAIPLAVSSLALSKHWQTAHLWMPCMRMVKDMTSLLQRLGFTSPSPQVPPRTTTPHVKPPSSLPLTPTHLASASVCASDGFMPAKTGDASTKVPAKKNLPVDLKARRNSLDGLRNILTRAFSRFSHTSFHAQSTLPYAHHRIQQLHTPPSLVLAGMAVTWNKSPSRKQSEGRACLSGGFIPFLCIMPGPCALHTHILPTFPADSTIHVVQLLCFTALSFITH